VKFILENSCNRDTIQKLIGVGDLFPAQPGEFTSFSDSICAGTNNVAFSIPNVPNVSYAWTYIGSGASISGSGSSISINFTTNAISGILRVTPTNFFGPGIPRELPIYIKAQPDVSISGESVICSGITVNLISNGAENYLWQNGSTENFISVSPSSTTNYTVIGISSNGCSKSASITVTVNTTPSLPSIIVIEGTNPFCYGSTLTLRSSALTGNIWSNGATTREVTLDSTQTINLYVSQNGCISSVTSITVTEKPQLIAQINSEYDGIFSTCELSTTINATSNADYPSSLTYQWIFPNSQVIYGINQIANQTGTYLLRVIPSDFCPFVQTTQIINVGIGSSPAIIPSGPTTICQGTDVVLNAPSGGSYLWSNGATTQNIVVTQEENYFVEIFSGPCSGISNSVFVDVNELVIPSITVETTSLSVCNSDVVVFTSITSDAGINPTFRWKKNGVIVGNANSYTDSTLLNNDQIQCELFTSGVCTDFPNVSSNILTINVSFCNVIWTGAEDNNWDNVNNWMPQQVPDFARSVIINSGTPYSPELRNLSSCLNLNLKSGAIIELNGNIFQLHGQLAGNGKFSGGGKSELHLLSSGNAGGVAFFQQNEYSKSLAKLILNCGNVFLMDTLNITEELKMQSGILETNNKLVLKANSKKSAVISEIVTPENCQIMGNVIVEKFAKGGLTGWATLGNPVKNEKIMGWQDDFATAGYPGAVGVAGEFVSIYWYDETAEGDLVNGYTIPSSANDTVQLGKGYMVYLGDGFTNTNDIVYDVVGEVQIGEYQFPVSYTSTPNNIFGDVDGWNLIANPYCHTIDWDSEALVLDNVDKSIYIYNADLQNYSTYVRNSDGIGINGGTNNIAAGQGFWIKASADNPYLLVNERVKRTNNIDLQRVINNSISTNFLKLKLSFDNKTDETILRFKDEASNGFDGNYDAIKLNSLKNDYPNISTKCNGLNYAINTIKDEEEILLNLKVSSLGNYKIGFNGVETFYNKIIYIKDNSNQSLIELSSDTIINFFVTDTLNFLTRYSLLFKEDNSLSLENEFNADIDVYPNPSGNLLNIKIPNANRTAFIEFVDAYGKTIDQINSPMKNEILNFNTEKLSKGVYFIKFTNLDGLIYSLKWIKN
jgi:hypothetical protein